MSAAALTTTSVPLRRSTLNGKEGSKGRVFQFTQIDVFTSEQLQGNQLAVFPDASRLSDDEMQAIARETHLSETTFIFPRDAAMERQRGVKVRIFTPERELPFGGHPTLGTAIVLRNRRINPTNVSEIALDLRVGRVPVGFSQDSAGKLFGEMHQVDPLFGKVHDRAEVATMIGVRPEEIHDEWPIQTVSTGLPFAIVPLRKLTTLQALRPNHEKIDAYFAGEKAGTDFFYITLETLEPGIRLRTRGLFAGSEDAATGSASGCTIAWMVQHGVAKSGEQIHIRQGVEMKRPSDIYARADSRDGKIINVKVGGNAVEVMQGEYHL